MWVRIPAHDIRRMNFKIDYFGNCYASWKNFLLANWQIFSKCYSHLVPLLMTGTEQWLYWFDNSSRVPDCFVKMAKLADFRFFVKKKKYPAFCKFFSLFKNSFARKLWSPFRIALFAPGPVCWETNASINYLSNYLGGNEREAEGRGGGHVVSMLTFYTDDPSSNRADVYSFFVKDFSDWKERKKQ